MKRLWPLTFAPMLVAVLAMSPAESPAGERNDGVPVGPARIEGQVLSGASPSSLAGASVSVIVYPEVMSGAATQMQTAASLPTVGHAVTDATGRFALSTADLDLPSTGGAERVNIGVLASSGDSLSVRHMTLERSPSGGWTVVEGSADTGAVDSLTPSSSARVELELQPAENVTYSAVTRAEASAAALPTARPPGASCTLGQSTDLGQRTVYLTSTHQTAASTSAKVTHSTGTSSSLGVGFSASGKSGSFSQSGTASSSSTTKVEMGPFTKPHHQVYSTKYSYRNYQVTCRRMVGLVWKTTKHWEARPSGHYGGSATSTAAAPPRRHCVNYTKGSWERSNGTGTTWVAGVKLSGAIGIDLTSRTNITNNVTIKHEFGGPRTLCGENDGPGKSGSGRVTVTPRQ